MSARYLRPAWLKLMLLPNRPKKLSTSNFSTLKCPKWLPFPAGETIYQFLQGQYYSQFSRRYCSEAEPDSEPNESSPNDKINAPRREKVDGILAPLPHRYNCCGCGAVLQSANPKRSGYIPTGKLEEWLSLVDDPSKVSDEGDDDEKESQNEGIEGKGVEEDEDGASDIEDFFPEKLDDTVSSDMHCSNNISSFICKRCFSLKNYNDALNITLQKDDYLRHLNSLKDKRALIVLLLDVTDFPSCVFPDLRRLLSPNSSVLIVANKIDLFPGKLTNSFWNKFREYIIGECEENGLDCTKVVGVRFVSVKKGVGVLELSQEIVKKWGNRGDVYLLGCTNVGKSSLFNKLLSHLCGSKPGEVNTDNNMLAPKATISLWPGTTLGLLSFPLVSVGKRRRLLAQQRAKKPLDKLQGEFLYYLIVLPSFCVDQCFMQKGEGCFGIFLPR